MRTDSPQPVRLADYRPPPISSMPRGWSSTSRRPPRVCARRSPCAAPATMPRRCAWTGRGSSRSPLGIDGRALDASEYAIDDEGLTIHAVAAAFTLTSEVEIDPAANTALMGLYISGGRFCTQCEAEGFRRITWFADRPDVLSRFSVRIEADASYVHLLSNGNLIASAT